MMTPRMLPDDPGLGLVDATWGNIQLHQLAAGVRTIGELELIAHARAGLPMIDSRRAEQFAQQRFPGRVVSRTSSFPRASTSSTPLVPRSSFAMARSARPTPSAVTTLLAAGYPAEALLYYRGGLHDWITLGLPTVSGEQQHSQQPQKETSCTT
jgi:rhodanese-related sulfurtransferase